MCNCIKELNKNLNEITDGEGKVKTAYRLTNDGLMIDYPSGMVFVYQRRKKDGTLEKKRSTTPLIPNYCPFCGKPYSELRQSAQLVAQSHTGIISEERK